MSDISENSITIEAPIGEVVAVLTDLASYPTWSTAIKSAEVKATDDQGRATSVKVSIDAGMMKDRVVLDYDWSAEPASLSFTMDEADLLTQMDGTYTLKALDADSTQVTYELEIAVSMPVPAMMITKGQQQTIDAALKELGEHLS